MALSDLARDRNGGVVGRYRLVHSGGISQTFTTAIRFVDGACEVDGKAHGQALARVVAALGSRLTITRLDAPDAAAPKASVAESPTAEDAPTTPVDRCALAASLHASGLSWAKVGDELGVSGERARQLAKRATDITSGATADASEAA